MKRRQSPQKFLLRSRLAACGLLMCSALFAGSVNAELNGERFFAPSDLLSDAQGLFSDTQCRQENRVSYLLHLMNHSGSSVISFLRTGWGNGTSEVPAAKASSQAQPESIAFAALILLTLSLVVRRSKARF